MSMTTVRHKFLAILVLLATIHKIAGRPLCEEPANLRVESEDLGPLGTGSNMFRCGLVHSSGVVLVGTYGPPPAVIWRYDPKTGRLEKLAAPGEYQLDCMVEAPNGIVYVGTAYGGLVYRLDLKSGVVTSLGSPAIESTSWIFTMIATRKGEIYGAKGVALFRLDWERDRLEPIELVPGDHSTPPPNASAPIVRQLEEDTDGKLWGDTNRCLFRFDPESRKIERLADMVAVDPACYALFLPRSPLPTRDPHFCLYSRYSGRRLQHYFYRYDRADSRVEPLDLLGMPKEEGYVAGPPEWWTDGHAIRLLAPWWDGEKLSVLNIDPLAKKVFDRWEVDGNFTTAWQLPGPGMYFISPGHLFQADAKSRRLKTVAVNPLPAECRCLAISPQRVLGTDTYDYGHSLTYDLKAGRSSDHGKVWADDHRANHGPAAFAGTDGRWLLANHSEGMPALWVTDTQTNRHWRIGAAAIQLVAFRDGTVWGTAGPNPPSIAFDPSRCWIAGWQARPGPLFRYCPGAKAVDTIASLGEVGPLVEAPGRKGRVLAAKPGAIWVYDPQADQVLQKLPLRADVVAAAGAGTQDIVYLLLRDGTLLDVRWQDAQDIAISPVGTEFGSAERSFFVLSRSGRVVGVGLDGSLTIFDPGSKRLARVKAGVPPPAGPAVDPDEDAWYFADRRVTRYRLDGDATIRSGGNP